MTADLVAFLRARLDDTARKARLAADDTCARWEASDEGVYGTTASHPGAVAVGAWGDFGPAGAHIAENDPARVLAEVDAKRRILDEFTMIHLPETSNGDTATIGAYVKMQAVLRLLALPYAGHPDYQPEWADSGAAAA